MKKIYNDNLEKEAEERARKREKKRRKMKVSGAGVKGLAGLIRKKGKMGSKK